MKFFLPFTLLVAGATLPAATMTFSLGNSFIGAGGQNGASLLGTLVSAVNFGDNTYNNSPITVTNTGGSEAISFTNDTTTWGNSDFTGSTPGTGDAAWDSLIQDTDWSNVGASVPFSLPIPGLTPGQQYQVELFAYDVRNASIAGRTQFYDDGLGNISPNITNGLGQSMIATFVAMNATETINVTNSSAPSLTAMIVRQAPQIPEPSRTLLLGVALTGLCLRRHKK